MYRPLYIVFRRYALAELSWLSPFAANITDCCSHCCCAVAMAILRAIKLVAALDHKRHLTPYTNTLLLNMVTITQTKWKPDFSVIYKKYSSFNYDFLLIYIFGRGDILS